MPLSRERKITKLDTVVGSDAPVPSLMPENTDGLLEKNKVPGKNATSLKTTEQKKCVPLCVNMSINSWGRLYKKVVEGNYSRKVNQSEQGIL